MLYTTSSKFKSYIGFPRVKNLRNIVLTKGLKHKLCILIGCNCLVQWLSCFLAALDLVSVSLGPLCKTKTDAYYEFQCSV